MSNFEVVSREVYYSTHFIIQFNRVNAVLFKYKRFQAISANNIAIVSIDFVLIHLTLFLICNEF